MKNEELRLAQVNESIASIVSELKFAPTVTNDFEIRDCSTQYNDGLSHESQYGELSVVQQAYTDILNGYMPLKQLNDEIDNNDNLSNKSKRLLRNQIRSSAGNTLGCITNAQHAIHSSIEDQCDNLLYHNIGEYLEENKYIRKDAFLKEIYNATYINSGVYSTSYGFYNKDGFEHMVGRVLDFKNAVANLSRKIINMYYDIQRIVGKLVVTDLMTPSLLKKYNVNDITMNIMLQLECTGVFHKYRDALLDTYLNSYDERIYQNIDIDKLKSQLGFDINADYYDDYDCCDDF